MKPRTRLSTHRDTSRQPIGLAALDLAEPPPPWQVVAGWLLRNALMYGGLAVLCAILWRPLAIALFFGPLLLWALLFGNG